MRKKRIFRRFMARLRPAQRRIAYFANARRSQQSPYIDDSAETSSGVYAQLRDVAFEAELERRLNAASAASMARYANNIA